MNAEDTENDKLNAAAEAAPLRYQAFSQDYLEALKDAPLQLGFDPAPLGSERTVFTIFADGEGSDL